MFPASGDFERTTMTELENYVAGLRISQGEGAGGPFVLLPWQKRLLRGAFAPSVQTAAVSVGRGNGKTTLFAATAAAAVGRRDHNGVICASWREEPKTAWTRQVIELGRTATSFAAMIFDCDSRLSQELAMASCVGAGPVPPPNYASTRRASGNMHVAYFLGRPVHRGEAARAKPLSYLMRVSEYYRAQLGSDPGYVGALSYNPVHGDYSTTYPRLEPYGLDELGAIIKKGWRIPKVPTTEVGRSWALFIGLCKRALRDTDTELEAIAYRMADEVRAAYRADHAFPDSEVRGILRSVYRYRARWRARGHAPWWIDRQSARGRNGGLKGGVTRRAAVRERDLRIVVLRDAGLSQREIAAAVGVNQSIVSRARARLLKEYTLFSD